MSNRTLGLMMGFVVVLIVAIAAVAVIAFAGGGGDDDNGVPADNDNGDNPPATGTGICAENRLITFGSDPVTILDPIQVRDDATAEYVVEIFGGLVTLDLDLNVVPDIAESWEVLDDGTRYVFTLRDDVVFHSGRRVTADDFKYSLERAADPASFSPTVRLYLGEIVGMDERVAGEADEISGVRVIDERTLEIEIEQPVSYFLQELTYPVAFVVDREQVEEDENWTRRPNGTGPFRIRSFQPGEEIVLIPNDRYHLGAPSLDEVRFELAGGSISTRYENDELHIGLVPVSELEAVRGGDSPLSEDYRPRPEMALQYLGLNVNQAPFDDPDVRRAFALALDVETLNEVRLFGALRVADSILPPEMPGHSEDLSFGGFDPEEAARLLAESEYADSMPRIILTYSGAGGAPPDVLVIFQDNWREHLGVEVELQAQEQAAFLRDLRSGTFQMFSAGWIADYPDPADFLAKLFASDSDQNELGYSNPDVDALLDEAAVEQDQERRFELYREAEEIILQDMPVIPTFWPVSHELVRSCVQNWPNVPMTVPRYRYIEIGEGE